MAKTYTATKHLYTLNQSKHSSLQSQPEQSSIDSQRQEFLNNYQQQIEMKKLIKCNEELMIKNQELQLKNQELQQLGQLSLKRNKRLEQQQKDLIKKLSYYQVSNKQLVLDIKKTSEQFIQIFRNLLQTRQNHKVSENQFNEVRQMIKKAANDKQKFIHLLEGVFEIISMCDNKQQFLQEKNKILGFFSKNVSQWKTTNKIDFQFDAKFELSRVDTLKQRVRSLQEELLIAKNEIARQINEKKKLISVYNDKIGRLRQLYDSLKERIDMQEEKSRREIRDMKNEKKQDNIRNILRQSKSRKQSFEIRKERGKRSYIGDGDYTHLELTELNEAIQNLQMQIIRQFQE